jgi:sugar phosphate isomerase/epimerase
MKTSLCILLSFVSGAFAADPPRDLFARDNLVAWCIVPFDAKKRGPEERAAMLEKMGIQRLAYDYRAEHIPTFDAELDALQRHHIELTAWWFPTELNDEAKLILDVIARHGVHPQLWVMGGGGPVKDDAEQRARVEAEAARIRPIAEAAAKAGCKVALYNHGAWFGEPENQLAIIEKLGMPNVGMVYNFHHGHEHLERLPALFPKMLPHLFALNLNGMTRDGENSGKKIMPLGQGDLDLSLLRMIRDSGWRGPVGILNHTDEDAEARLLDNRDGLAWLVAQLDGGTPGPKPVPRSWHDPSPAPAPQK